MSRRMDSNNLGLEEEPNNNETNTSKISSDSIAFSLKSTASNAGTISSSVVDDGSQIFKCKICPFMTHISIDFQSHKRIHEPIVSEMNLSSHKMPLDAHVSNGGDSVQDSDYEIQQMQNSYATDNMVSTISSSDFVHCTENRSSDSGHKHVPVNISSLTTSFSGQKVNARAKPGPKPNSRLPRPKTGCAPVREAVDPAKYLTIQETDGIKFACSKCGNIYKWRKSLNKHWKEKHDGEIPDPRTSLTTLNIPRPTKTYVYDVNDKANGMSYIASRHSLREQYLYNRQNNGNCATFMTEQYSKTSSAIRNALRKPTGSNVSKPNDETLHKSSSYNVFEKQTESVFRNTIKNRKKSSISLNEKGRVYKFNDVDWSYANNVEALDLSTKSDIIETVTDKNFDQQEPIDLSMKSQVNVLVSTIKRDTENVNNNQNKAISSAHSKQEYTKLGLTLLQRKYECLQCFKAFRIMKELNEHFLKQHLHVIQLKNETNASQKLETRLPDTIPETTQLYKYLTMNSAQKKTKVCMVCGVTFQWQWALAKHFELDHGILPNPYDKYLSGLSDPSNDDNHLKAIQCSESSPVTRDGSDMSNNPQSNLCQINATTRQDIDEKQDQYIFHTMTHEQVDHTMANFICPNDNYVTLTEEDTAFVIPQAPEENIFGNTFSDNSICTSDNSATLSDKEMILPFKCNVCEYRARWPSEISQHMKNHSDEKPYLCPRCSYRSKWKWDVVKHLKRCGGGTIDDVIDTTKQHKINITNPSKLSDMTFDANKEHELIVDYQSGILSNCSTEVLHSDDCEEINVSQFSRRGEKNDFVNTSEESVSSFGDRVSPRSTTTKSDCFNQSSHVCLHCPFIGNSQAELKRHFRVHSDEKPFICKTCGYCSKWKCDLKKHLKTYNHISAVPLTYGGHGRKPADWKENKEFDISDIDSSDERMDCDKDDLKSMNISNKRHLFKCDKCDYVTYKKKVMDCHMNIHRLSTQNISDKLKCKKCSFVANDLSTFLNHKLIHSAPKKDDLSENKVKLPSSDRSMSRHRRKASKQSRIITSSALKAKRDTHCLEASCDRNKSNEAACNSLISSDAYAYYSGRESVSKQMYKCLHCPYKTDNRNNHEKHIKFHCTGNKYTCEWCTWSSDRLNLLYRHAQLVHPNELTLQEKETFFGKIKEKKSTAILLTGDIVEKEYKYDTTEILKDDIKESVSWSKKQDVSNIAKRRLEMQFEEKGFGEEMPIELRSKRRRRLKTCPKCGYITDNVTTLQRHLSKHGSNSKYTCDFCDYSVDRQHIVEYHVKIVHIGKEKDTPDIKGINAEEEHENEEEKIYPDIQFESDEETTMENCKSGNKRMVRHENNGQFEIRKENCKINDLCRSCPFFSNDLSLATYHTVQQGAKNKYTCDICSHSLDHLHSLIHHMKECHNANITGSNGADVMENVCLLDMTNCDSNAKNHVLKEKIHQYKKIYQKAKHSRYFCTRCIFTTKNYSSLRRHKKIHKQYVKKIDCIYCTYKASSKKLYRFHCKKYHMK